MSTSTDQQQSAPVQWPERPYPYGTFSRIARELDPPVTPQHVRDVAIGRSKSARVQELLDAARRQVQESRASAAAQGAA